MRARELRLAAMRQLVDGRAAGAKRHHLAREPFFEFRRGCVERKIEHRLLRVEALQLLGEIIEAAANEVLRLGERQLASCWRACSRAA